MQKNHKQICSCLVSWPVSRVVKMPPFHGGDQGFDTPTGYLNFEYCNLIISGRSMVGQRFLVPLVEVRIFTGEFTCTISLGVKHHTCHVISGVRFVYSAPFSFLWYNKDMNETILLSILFALVAILFVLIFVLIFQIKKITIF